MNVKGGVKGTGIIKEEVVLGLGRMLAICVFHSSEIFFQTVPGTAYF